MSYNLEGRVYPVSQLTEFLNEDEIKEQLWIQEGKVFYLNTPISFDIETTSFEQEAGLNQEVTKFATMYIWQFGIGGHVIYGRTWDEFMNFMEAIHVKFQLSTKRRIIIYVHNLGFEFQFIQKLFNWDKVFAPKNRRPLTACAEGFEFRCSYYLSNYALEYIGDNLLSKYKVEKLVGALDYSLLRHSKTPLTDIELVYAVNDVRVVMAYIQEKIEQDGDITKIPLTNTGYVRNYCREECFFEDSETEEERKRTLYNYRALMKSLVVQDVDEYDELKRAFQGGFTHASALHSGKLIENVGSADLASSYPYCMVSQYFPMTKGEYIGHVDNPRLFEHYLKNYCCVFDIEFHNLKPRVIFENYISLSHSVTFGKYSVNNGRIIDAEKLQTTMTELDYDIVSQLYTWSAIKVMNLRVYKRGYLPRALILSMLKLYKDKTELKGIIGKETEYMVSKNMINAGFGMMVTAILREDFTFIDKWAKELVDKEEQLAGYNKNWNRFLFYGWGVWVTAHARHNLFSAILEFKEDYVYSDTDSIKAVNFNSHASFFENYNRKVRLDLLNMCNHYNIDFQMCQPRDKKGKPHLMGVWEIEEGYKLFKTCGAKRYMYQYYDGFMTFTIAGINKKVAMPYLIAKYNEIPLDSEEFRFLQRAYSGKFPGDRELLVTKNYDYLPIFYSLGDGFYVPAGYTGKLTITYIDYEFSHVLIDYYGVPSVVHEYSALHMEPQSYFMSMMGDYIKFLQGIEYVEIT